ncbi:RB1-inducible coiled-coil protein 1 isoform X1 [Neopsephotus bourkii]|uniref:RB1-inducible coiled-coil protein 1 isoform X1 n=3 Tax=Neopsephotus bourkii TaxID=309878 RepID=UPI002AA56B85|nr:RB1-inducible coiled-coil protein 1 isoform X1 [Neopsephotus bourkii]XP_061198914.1 RB1-inducible coiled-coil protein 1 isoform X1 [Neopsephotus bourkii]XP_061198915.1 RB1-inducible coiled-coil protein 1 isoform X1 [Neopsephotus bourkii]
MKLYVFLVNTGTTLTFDTELAVQNVADLKHAIQTKYKIAIQHQVLVVNGGECMAPDRRVCSYSAGTDTNPIFLFNKEMILCERPPAIPKTTFSAENEMELKVEESLMMPAVFHTVASRTQLAVEMYEVAKKLCSFCEGLVHDEHLQHQGWAAIMANLEDCTYSYQKLLFKFENVYSSYLQSIDDIKLKLTHLGSAVSIMAKIPLLECLTRHSYRECLGRLDSSAEHGGAESEETDDGKSPELVLDSEISKVNNKSMLASFCKSVEHTALEGTDPENVKDDKESGQNATVQDNETSVELKDDDQPSFNVSLLDWINVQDRPNDVESLVRKCFDSMSRLDPRIIQPFLSECRQTIAKLDNQNMKAIKGLEDRLYALDQMIASCSRLVNEQKELAQGFLANQKRAENLKDPSVLPDLCLSHANQLMIMLTNHRKLLDIKQKCTTAKQELANNLQVRLKWCCFVMLHADQDGEKLQALLRLVTELLERVKVVEALSTVPQMYCLAVVEVVRRKMFIKHYREWAGALIKDGKRLYEAEKAKRESFGKLFRKSFLRNRLFRGLDSWPPSFCTRKPRRFDSELPDISLSDLQFLQSFCPSEVQPLLRVPILCDFEPLHQHVRALHNLVKAAQSLDEMSQTITDLLNEQKASNSQASPQSATTPRMESTTGTAIATSSRTPPSLSLQGPLCPPVCPPAPLEELSPDSIDAHTFDFETIAHPNLEQALKQGSLDLDSLAESPESDFMSAVNEFVIEENPASPNVISDPQSPEMMVESLYSSVINAIDSRRMQDTNSGVKDVSTENTSLSVCMEKCRVIAQDSKVHLRGIKEDLCHFRTLVQREQCDFSNSLKCTSLEIVNTIEKVKLSLEKTLKDKHQKELQSLKSEYETRISKLLEDGEENEKKIKKLKGDLLGLEEVIQNKNDEFAMVKNEKEAVVCLQNEKDQKLLELECQMETQNCEIKELRQSREIVLEDLKKLHVENNEKLQLLRAELESLEQSHLKELESNLQARHLQEFEKVLSEHKDCLDKLKKENQHRLEQMQESHAVVVQEKQKQVEELQLKVSDLSDLRCKLEVELALKEAETDEMKLLLEESRNQQQEKLKSQIEKETETLKKEIDKLNHRIQISSDEYQAGLLELRTLMTIEKDQCISELVDRYEEESNLLRTELNKVTLLHQKTSEAEKRLSEQVTELQSKLELEVNALEKEKTEKLSLCEQQEKYEAIIHKLKEEKELLVSNQEQDRQLLIQKLNCEKEDAVQTACKEFELQREAAEKGLLEKIQQLEIQVNRSPPTESSAESSLVAELKEKLQEEKMKFLEQLEEQEKRKNEEMQNIRTSLTAEQQTNFNTVLAREKMKKESIINDLSDKLKVLTQQQEKDKDLIETLSEDRARLLEEKKKLEEEVNKLRSSNFSPSTYSVATSEACGACAADISDTDRLVSDIASEGRMDSTMETSMMAVHENVHMSEEKQRIMLLERTLQLKEEENKRLNQRLMSQSMSSVSSRHSEKIAIRDFQVGDLVLIILDERHDNYVLFTVSPTLYFLHSESLAALDLKPGECASGTSRRPWVLGKVMEKEYCQAKKAQNRFKVPLGTKFYRVKAVPWNKKV